MPKERFSAEAVGLALIARAERGGDGQGLAADEDADIRVQWPNTFRTLCVDARRADEVCVVFHPAGQVRRTFTQLVVDGVDPFECVGVTVVVDRCFVFRVKDCLRAAVVSLVCVPLN